ncbi:MAG: hypothetical protein ACM3S4_12345 [Burkholderiales bacterium]
MKQMQEDEIIKFLKENIEPIEHNAYGIGYRASAYLLDGTFLPCVVFYGTNKKVELAIKRFKEEQKKPKFGYYDTVKSFVTRGNRINSYDISNVEKSKYAFPLSILKQIHGETRMVWTGFVAKMKDGKCFSFGTVFDTEFFDMPESYSVEDIEEIINHSYTLQTGEIKSCHDISVFTNDNKDFVYRERPYFECYLDNL